MRLSLGTGVPAKPLKPKKSVSKNDKGKKKRDPSDLFLLVKKKDVIGLEDFLLNATPEEVRPYLRAQELAILILDHVKLV